MCAQNTKQLSKLVHKELYLPWIKGAGGAIQMHIHEVVCRMRAEHVFHEYRARCSGLVGENVLDEGLTHGPARAQRARQETHNGRG